MNAVFSSSDDADGIPAGSTMPAPPCVTGQSEPTQSVSAVPHLSIRELQLHLSSCHYLASLASARYRGSRSLADAQEAGRWLVLKEEAQKAVLALRREQFNADELTMAGEWTRGLS